MPSPAPKARADLEYFVAFTTLFIYLAYFRVLGPIIERFRGAGLVFVIVVSTYLLRNVALRPVWDLARLVVRERRRILTRQRTAGAAGPGAGDRRPVVPAVAASTRSSSTKAIG